jgi:ankyrin repeat protein
MDPTKYEIFQNFDDKTKKSICKYLYYTTFDNEQYIKSLTDINVEDFQGRTPLNCACQHGNIKLVKWLLDNIPYRNVPGGNCDVNYVNKYGQTALMWACAFGHLDVIQELINVGANINIIDNFGFSALDICSHNYKLSSNKIYVSIIEILNKYT